MKHIPIFLDIKGKPVLVVGGDEDEVDAIQVRGGEITGLVPVLAAVFEIR